MLLEYKVIILLWITGLISLIKFVPKNRRRRMSFAVLLCQAFTWLSSMFHVKYHLLSFPVKEFPKATDLLITTEYLLYPLIFGFYIIYEPKKSILSRISYLSFWISILTVLDVLLEKYTDLIEYVHYDWYWTWVNFFALFSISNIIYQWCFTDLPLLRKHERTIR
ncbi:CBO0543 family protein [Neobacillus mesonae]|uniref:CBO0543 family protein n=1 Tax=Neobacillus mesonae TaxID=1193713 RepID=UPI0037C9D074